MSCLTLLSHPALLFLSHSDVLSPDHRHIYQLPALLSLLLFVHFCWLHSLFLIHFFHQAHRSRLIKDRIKTANRALTCSPQWTQDKESVKVKGQRDEGRINQEGSG